MRMIQRRRDSRRRGVAAVFVVVCLVTLMGFAALTVDVGALYNTRNELQRSADAAALAGALSLMKQDRVMGGSTLTGIINDAHTEASDYVSANKIGKTTITANSGDIKIGYLADPTSSTESLDFSTPSRYNAVSVLVRRDETANGPIDLMFAWIFGHKTTKVTASGTAALMDGITGWKVTGETGNAGLLPLALRKQSWLDYLGGTLGSGDNYSYDEATGAVTPGPDGIIELNLYPGSGSGQLPPGNFGTVDIGSPGNSTADLSRQIREGVNEDDLSYFGGELKLGSDGTLILNGDTGLSAGIKDDLTSIIGMPRAIPIFTTVSGPGNNANFTVVGFVGIRIMYVKLTGSMSSKKVLIQPAVLIDDAAQTGPSNGESYFVYQPVRLVR